MGAFVTALTCPTVSTCQALLEYSEQNRNRPAADTLTNGTWATAELPVPADSLDTGLIGPALATSCATPTDCVALSSYQTQPGTQ
jgi:hypothetical protein